MMDKNKADAFLCWNSRYFNVASNDERVQKLAAQFAASAKHDAASAAEDALKALIDMGPNSIYAACTMIMSQVECSQAMKDAKPIYTNSLEMLVNDAILKLYDQFEACNQNVGKA